MEAEDHTRAPDGVPPQDKAPEEVSQDKASEDKAPENTAPAESELPPLTPAEFRVYNRMAEKMDVFHNHFRQSWTMLHDACTANRRPAKMSLRQFLDAGLEFCHGLAMHHDIEEAHIFPRLAVRMPEFQTPFSSQLKKANSQKSESSKLTEKRARLVLHHRQIHAGMDELEAYLSSCKSRERELEMSVMRAKMDSWGAVLWEHLDEEVRTLGAENMRRYWTVDELRRMPF